MATETTGKMTDLGWLNDPAVEAKVDELRKQGESFVCTNSDVYGYDSVYTSRSGLYRYHICSN